MYIKKVIYDKILNSITPAPPEMGGIIGGTYNVITEFESDKGVNCYPGCYTPDTKKLNGVIQRWEKAKVQFYGIFHSHLHNQETLSEEDLKYIKRILSSMPDRIAYLYFPLIMDGNKIVPYRANITTYGLEVIRERIIIV